MKRLVVPLLSLLMAGTGHIYAQHCALSSPSNMIVQADKGQEGATVRFPDPSTLVSGECGTVTYSPASGSFFRIGSHSIIVTAPNGQKTFFTLTITDNEPPVLSELTLSARRLEPGKNKLKKVGVYYSAYDNAQHVNTVVTVKSNDPASGSDWEVINNHLVKLRSTPLADGSTKVYTITVSCTDASGNLTRRSTTVSVPGISATAFYKVSPEENTSAQD